MEIKYELAKTLKEKPADESKIRSYIYGPYVYYEL